ncbi:MbtH family NRPS accessory protein [Spartinivicinus ruber]|uniref:MbtH family NRPS accessory protein n=1 Tax=Spartinivicinus ruber TaxID=2683272 RepID=UPI0013D3F6C2|nr:MbtH family NRPS accessory protein [Spartinivicinus ruber]
MGRQAMKPYEFKSFEKGIASMTTPVDYSDYCYQVLENKAGDFSVWSSNMPLPEGWQQWQGIG